MFREGHVQSVPWECDRWNGNVTGGMEGNVSAHPPIILPNHPTLKRDFFSGLRMLLKLTSFFHSPYHHSPWGPRSIIFYPSQFHIRIALCLVDLSKILYMASFQSFLLLFSFFFFQSFPFHCRFPFMRSLMILTMSPRF